MGPHRLSLRFGPKLPSKREPSSFPPPSSPKHTPPTPTAGLSRSATRNSSSEVSLPIQAASQIRAAPQGSVRSHRLVSHAGGLEVTAGRAGTRSKLMAPGPLERAWPDSRTERAPRTHTPLVGSDRAPAPAPSSWGRGGLRGDSELGVRLSLSGACHQQGQMAGPGLQQAQKARGGLTNAPHAPGKLLQLF